MPNVFFARPFLISLFCIVVLVGVVTDSKASEDEEVVATLFGQPVTLKEISPDQDELSAFAKAHSVSKAMAEARYQHAKLADKIMQAVIDDYVKANSITADPDLVEKFKQRFEGDYSASDDQASDAPLTSIDDVAKKQVLRWQIDKHLYEQFGGTVIFQQSNPQMPAGAYEKLLKAYRDKGAFSINDKKFQAVFWEGIEPPYPFELNPEQVDFSQPWWL